MKKNNPGCGCCLSCQAQAWVDLITTNGWSQYNLGASGTYMSYSIAKTAGFASGGTGYADNVRECANAASGSTNVTIATAGFCSLIKSHWRSSSGNTCNGVFYPGVTQEGVAINASIATTCPGGVPTFNQQALMVVPIDGCNSDFLLPNPVDDLGYSVTQTNFFGDPIAWRRFGSGGYYFQITGFAGVDPIQGPIVGGVRKYVQYLVQAGYSKTSTNPADVLSSITLICDYDPAVVTGYVNLI